MKSRLVTMSVVIALGLIIAAACYVASQPEMPGGGPPGGPPGMMGPGGPPMGPPPGPPPVLVVADGVVYVACMGKLTAYEAKTLKKLGEATYWEPPKPPSRPKQTEQ